MADDGALVAAAEAALGETFRGPVRLDAGEVLRERYRNRVLRCRVLEAPSGAPPSVILKAAVGEDESAALRFRNEWTATQFLNERAGDPPLCARLLGADRESRLIVLEDLGDGACLADRLLGEDPELARAALRTYAASMGRLHATTAGAERDWRRIRSAPGASEGADEGAGWLPAVERFRALCADLDLPLAAGFEDEVRAVAQTLDDPGPFNAFAPGDTCPDNHRLMTGSGYLRFFDFEFAGFRHALLDAAYFYLPFPTCWCVNRLPDALPAEMEAVYRAELVHGCPEAADDAVFYTAMSHACACWTVITLSESLDHALREDGRWGISTLRQRHRLRLENFARVTERFGHLPALTQTAGVLSARLGALWPPPESEMPLYPPFRPRSQD